MKIKIFSSLHNSKLNFVIGISSSLHNSNFLLWNSPPRIWEYEQGTIIHFSVEFRISLRSYVSFLRNSGWAGYLGNAVLCRWSGYLLGKFWHFSPTSFRITYSFCKKYHKMISTQSFFRHTLFGVLAVLGCTNWVESITFFPLSPIVTPSASVLKNNNILEFRCINLH